MAITGAPCKSPHAAPETLAHTAKKSALGDCIERLIQPQPRPCYQARRRLRHRHRRHRLLQRRDRFHLLPASLALGQMLLQPVRPIVWQLSINGQDNVFLCQFAIHKLSCLTSPLKIFNCNLRLFRPVVLCLSSTACQLPAPEPLLSCVLRSVPCTLYPVP